MKTCPLCSREIPPEEESRHHLVPRLRGGKTGKIEILHRVCHAKIHSVFTETELAREYSSIEALKTHEEMARFIAWIRNKPIDLKVPTREKSDKSRKRRRR